MDHIPGSFVRQALKDGLTMQETRGYNPYKFGFVGRLRLAQHRQSLSSGQFLRRSRLNDGNIEAAHVRPRLARGTMDVRLENPAGLTGVWAEENTRASLFDAM